MNTGRLREIQRETDNKLSEKPEMRELGLVSLFNGISIFVGYLMPKLLL